MADAANGTGIRGRLKYVDAKRYGVIYFPLHCHTLECQSMTTSARMLMKSMISLEDTPLSPAQLGYFHGMSQDEAYDIIFKLFLKMSKEEGVTRALLARRLRKDPAQITKWLAASGNWTLDTYTDLALAMGHKPTFGVARLSELRASNEHHPELDRPQRLAIDDLNAALNSRNEAISANDERSLNAALEAALQPEFA